MWLRLARSPSLLLNSVRRRERDRDESGGWSGFGQGVGRSASCPGGNGHFDGVDDSPWVGHDEHEHVSDTDTGAFGRTGRIRNHQSYPGAPRSLASHADATEVFAAVACVLNLPSPEHVRAQDIRVCYALTSRVLRPHIGNCGSRPSFRMRSQTCRRRTEHRPAGRSLHWAKHGGMLADPLVSVHAASLLAWSDSTRRCAD